MTIETKHNIGDKVWSIPNGKPVKFTIERIYVKVYKDICTISYEYYDDNEDRTYRLPEYMVFPTKEELLKSL